MQFLDENIILKLMHSSSFAVVVMDLDFKVTYWNKEAENMFGLKSEDVLGTMNPISTDNTFRNFNVGKIVEEGIIHFNNAKVRGTDKSVNVEGSITGIKDSSDKLTGLCMCIAKPSGNSMNGSLCDYESSSPKKRTFESIRFLILASLMKKRKTINQISKDIGVNWKTVENHLTHLAGKKLIHEIFSSKYVRIFEITEHGKARLKNLATAKNISVITNMSSSDAVVFTNVSGLQNGDSDDADNERSLAADDLEFSREVEK
jgi:PAS domain S-box-containing protein